MRQRRIIVDSDDDIDDFPSLRPASPRSESTSTSPTKPRKLPAPQIRAPKRTQKPTELESSGSLLSTAPTTGIRRRKLGKINNDASLLRPWGDSRESPLKKMAMDGFDIPEIDLPQDSSPEPARRKSRIELRTRRTRRISDLPADDAGELSTEEASVLEDVTLEEEYGEGNRSNSQGNSQGNSEVNIEHIAEQDTCREEQYIHGPFSSREMVKSQNEGHKSEEGEVQTEKQEKDDGENEDEVDEDEDSYSDSDSEASEFQDSSICSDSSFGSLGGYFARSPSRRPAVPRRKDLQVQIKMIASSSRSAKTTNAYEDEESSVFFSAEESFSDRRPDTKPQPLQQSLDKGNRAQAPPPAPSSRSRTPPLEVPDQMQASRLNSPTKKLPRIPQTPHRPTADEFWDQLVVDDWNMEHSPRKLLFDPNGSKAGKPTKTAIGKTASGTAAPSTSPKKGMTAAAKAKDAKKEFQKAKHEMAEKFLAELDNTITDGQLSRLAASTGGVRIEWTNKLNTTAGRANWRRETLRPKKAAPIINLEDGSVTDTSSTTAAVTRVHHHASIELAEKVIDDEHRLLNVIAHEFCHLANFMVSGIAGNPHGKEFKAWAAKCSQHFGSRGIQVTTKHAYEIDFKYVWTCEACATDFKRHSKSIDPARHRCGACKGVLKQTKPVPRGGGVKSTSKAGAGGNTAPPGPSEYQKFMKEHMAIVRRENPNSPQKMIMTLVADKWTKAKEQKKAASSLATAVAQDKGGNGDAEACVDSLGKALVDLTLN